MLSTRRAIMQHAPEEFREWLLWYRRDLRCTLRTEFDLRAWGWVVGTDEGRRLNELVRWVGTLRVNRRIRADDARRTLFSELYRAVSSLQKCLGGPSSFLVGRLEADVLFRELRIRYLAPLATSAKKSIEGASQGGSIRKAAQIAQLRSEENARLVRQAIESVRRAHPRYLRDDVVSKVVASGADPQSPLHHLLRSKALNKKALLDEFANELPAPTRGPRRSAKTPADPG